MESDPGALRPGLTAESGTREYAVEVRVLGESRPDRALALLSRSILEGRRHAELSGRYPLAIMCLDNLSLALQRRVEDFHRMYAPDVAVGLVCDAGGSYFIGEGLESLGTAAPTGSSRSRGLVPRKANDLFSDLNQWMLKVLLAPELPEDLLNAPRADYRSVSALAGAANVSLMSASRFVQRLREDGFLDDSGGAFRLVRRHELFKLWQSAALRSSPELRMSYLIPGSGIRQLQKSASRLDACIGLFAAADLLNLGHVSGVPPHLYLRRLAPSSNADWPGLVPSGPGEHPQIILRQASAPESMFRGAVRVDDVPVADVLQIWLDASAHPARGAEQADLLRRKVLSGVLGE